MHFCKANFIHGHKVNEFFRHFATPPIFSFHCGIFQKKSINLQRYGNFRTFSYPDFKRFIQIHKHHENNMRKQASKQASR
jgi:hypothetical protein